MKRTALIIAIGIAVILLPLCAQQDTAQKQKSDPKPATQSSARPEPSRGEIVFKENCSRCHNIPQGFPPHISGTIVRHMRVRASLSAADEKAILHFLNP